jgi:hypothetical protein
MDFSAAMELESKWSYVPVEASVCARKQKLKAQKLK